MTSAALDAQGFGALLRRLARAWEALDASAAAACFTVDAVYMEPPDVQLFSGRTELEAYFSALAPGTYLDLHGVWFDEPSQTGAVEFGFGVRGRLTADYGVAVAETRDHLVASWREYVRKGPAEFDVFTAVEGKAWSWHGGNYP
jgi:hypothetical protein